MFSKKKESAVDDPEKKDELEGTVGEKLEADR